jgi:hypothetical protein
MKSYKSLKTEDPSLSMGTARDEEMKIIVSLDESQFARLVPPATTGVFGASQYMLGVTLS